MYDNAQVKADVPKDKTLIQYFSDEFQDLNEQQEKIISAIEEKLNVIIDKREPQVDTVNKGETPCIIDFRDSVRSKLTKLRANTNKLDQIYAHLQEIV
jgi:hypothetical protein